MRTRTRGATGGRISPTARGARCARTTATTAMPGRYFPHDLARSKAYRWGEDGIAGFCDRYQILCWSMAFWNERDPILKERYFGLVPTRGESRRGREGVLLLRRRAAEPRVPADALQVSAARVSVRAADRGEPPPRRGRSGVRADRHRHLRRRPLLRHRDRDREGGSGVDRLPRHRAQPRPGARAASTSSRSSGSATPGRGAATRRARRRVDRVDGRAARSSPTIRTRRRWPACCTTRASARTCSSCPPGRELLFTDNETNAPRVFGRTHVAQPLREGRLPPPHRQWRADAVNPAQQRDEGVRLDARRDRAGRSRARCACACGPARQRARLAGDAELRRRSSTSAAPKPTSSTRRSTRRAPSPRSATSSARPSPGCSGQAELPLRRRRLARRRRSRAIRRPTQRQRGRNARWRHLNSMRILSMPDKWEYPWFAAWDLAFHAVVFALIDAAVREGAALADAVRAVPASERPDPRVRMGVLRSQSARARLGGLARLQHGPHPQRQGRPRVPREVLSQAAAEFHLVGEQGRPRRQQRLRRRLPRARQHRRLRSQRAAARRRGARAERRHRLDGDVLPGDDAHRARAGEDESRRTKGWPRNSSSTTSTSARP